MERIGSTEKLRGSKAWLRVGERWEEAQSRGGKPAPTYFILISFCFFSFAFTKAVGSKRATRPPRQDGEEAGSHTCTCRP